MAKKDKKNQMHVEWIGGPFDGEIIDVNAEDDFVEFTFKLPGEGSYMKVEIPVEFRENGKPIAVWRPEFSRYSF
jgi:hypothetical protein